ncbi:MAG: hypothetical protein ACXVKA_16705 [Acidimicrobiia bacterium]
MFRRRRKQEQGGAAEPIYGDLREQALRTAPGEIGLEPTPQHPRVYGVLMEMAYPNATATLVSFCDGTTSLYTSTGGGVIGGGEHAAVAQATGRFITVADQLLDAVSATTSFPAPTVGAVAFQVLTFEGGFTTEVDAQALGENRDRLSPLFYAGQEVLTQLRLMDEARPTA